MIVFLLWRRSHRRPADLVQNSAPCSGSPYPEQGTFRTPFLIARGSQEINPFTGPSLFFRLFGESQNRGAAVFFIIFEGKRYIVYSGLLTAMLYDVYEILVLLIGAQLRSI